MASNQSMGLFILRCIFVLLGFIWSMYAATQFLGDCQPPKRKALAAYPMGLFYFVISWLVVSHNWVHSSFCILKLFCDKLVFDCLLPNKNKRHDQINYISRNSGKVTRLENNFRIFSNFVPCVFMKYSKSNNHTIFKWMPSYIALFPVKSDLLQTWRSST